MSETAIQKLEVPKVNTPDASEFGVMRETAAMLCKTGFLPQAINTPEKAVAIILTGRELGIGTMAALNTINVISGKPTVSPQLMLALIERSGQLEDIQITNVEGAVKCTMKRKGRSPHTEFFGEAEATAMQLRGKDNYKKQAFTMYKWRAVAACARIVFPDVITGLYTPDEMGADVTDDGELLPPAKDNIRPLPTTEKAVVGEVVDDPTPEQRRQEKIDHVTQLGKWLNDHNDDIKWSGKTIHEFINQTFDVEDGLNSLDFESLDQLIATLTERLGLIQMPDIPLLDAQDLS